MSLALDLRYALRFLSRTPAFTLPAVASLALGIAVNTTMFSVVNAVLLRPLGSSDGGELVRIGRSLRGDGSFRSATYEELRYLRDHASSLADLAGGQLEAYAVGGPDGARMMATELVTSNYFTMLGVPPVLGRAFSAEEERGPADGPVAVISDRLWRRRFGADPAVVGATLPVNNVPFTIVGVAAPGFTGVTAVIDLWLPVAVTDLVNHRTDPGGSPSMGLLGRLTEGVSIEAARAELEGLARRMAEENPARDRDRGFTIASAQGVHPAFYRPLAVFLLLLMLVVAVVLLIACANAASLLLARASARQGELAVRLALGANRGRVVGQLLVESLILALLGGAAGVVLAVWPIGLMNTIFSAAVPIGVPIFLDLRLDARVLLFTVTATLLTAITFGLLPALQATRVDLVSALRDSRSLLGRPRSRLRGALMIVQVALSFVLLVGAGLLFRSLHNASRVDVGFDPDQVVVASFNNLQAFGYDRDRIHRFHADWLDRVRMLPGVERAAFADFIPLGESGGHPSALRVPGRTTASGPEELTAAVGRVSDAYFATVRQPLIRGRDFEARDRPPAPRVAIVNEAMARRFWPGEDPVGKRIGLGEDLAEHEIVGIAGDARYSSFGGEVAPFVFVPAFPGEGTLHVRASLTPADTLAALNRLARDIERNLPPYVGRTMREAMASSLLPARIVQLVFGVAGVIALLLASGGLYGLVCYTLERRRKEIGIRVALGATRWDAFRVIVGGAVRLTAAGVAIGVVIAAAAMRLLSALLYGLSPTDPLTFAGIAALLLLVTLAAGSLAVRQGLNLDPVALLRAE